MMVVEVKTQVRGLGRAEVVSTTFRFKNGETAYRVRWTGQHGEKFEFEVRHDRRKGAWALAEKVCRKASKELRKFYEYPEDKETKEGLIRASDIPERYRAAFGKWLGVATVALMERRLCPGGCLDVDMERKDEIGYNASDLRGFLDAMVYGRHKVFD